MESGVGFPRFAGQKEGWSEGVWTEGLQKPLLTGRVRQGHSEPHGWCRGAGERSPRQNPTPVPCEFSLETGPDTGTRTLRKHLLWGAPWFFLFLGDGDPRDDSKSWLAGLRAPPRHVLSPFSLHCPSEEDGHLLQPLMGPQVPVPYLKVHLGLVPPTRLEHEPHCRSHRTWTSCLRPPWPGSHVGCS